MSEKNDVSGAVVIVVDDIHVSGVVVVDADIKISREKPGAVCYRTFHPLLGGCLLQTIVNFLLDDSHV